MSIVFKKQREKIQGTKTQEIRIKIQDTRIEETRAQETERKVEKNLYNSEM